MSATCMYASLSSFQTGPRCSMFLVALTTKCGSTVSICTTLARHSSLVRFLETICELQCDHSQIHGGISMPTLTAAGCQPFCFQALRQAAHYSFSHPGTVFKVAVQHLSRLTSLRTSENLSFHTSAYRDITPSAICCRRICRQAMWCSSRASKLALYLVVAHRYRSRFFASFIP